MESYCKLHSSFIKDQEQPAVDMVSMEEIVPTGRNYVMYLRLTTKEIIENNNIKRIERVPVHLVPYDTMSAYQTFIINKVQIDPETRELIRPSFLNRIVLYKQTVDEFGVDFLPNNEDLDGLFQRFLRNEELTYREKLYLRSFLHLDNTSVIHEVNVEGLEIRNEIEKILLEKGLGSWAFRRTSIVSNDLVVIKSISFCTFNENLKKNECKHIIICHVAGLGYYSVSLERESVMPNIGDNSSLPNFEKTTVYPCFLDLFTFYKKYYQLQGEQYVYHL
jgi:hypothetical protein